MTWYRVELRGESREVYSVEADSAEEAREVWAERGTLEIQECYGMGVESVSEEESV